MGPCTKLKMSGHTVQQLITLVSNYVFSLKGHEIQFVNPIELCLKKKIVKLTKRLNGVFKTIHKKLNLLCLHLTPYLVKKIRQGGPKDHLFFPC